MTEPKEKKKANFFWPDVSTLESAHAAAMGGVAVACIVAAITAAVAIYASFKSPVLNISAWSFIDVAIFAGLAYGMWRNSRGAAIGALAFYLLEQGYQWATIGPKNPVLAVFFTLFLISAVRGTFSYHKLAKQDAQNAGV